MEQFIAVFILYSPLLVGLVVFIFISRSRRAMLWANKIQSNIDIKLKKRQVKRWDNPPFSEWRMPVMFLLCSSMIFILITAGFGVTIDTRSREMSFHMDVGGDWEGGFGFEPEPELYKANPMYQFPPWVYIIMVIGYYIGVIAFMIMWLGYCKWKWLNIPVDYRIEIKKVKDRKPLYVMDGRVKKDE